MRSIVVALSMLSLLASCSQKSQSLEIQSGKRQAASAEAKADKKSDIFSKVPQTGAPVQNTRPVIIEDIPVVKRPEVIVPQPEKVEVLPPEEIVKVPETPKLLSFRDIVTPEDFDQMFPTRDAFYTYEGLAEAADELDAFAKTGDVDTRKREVAALLANVAHETGDLKYIREQGSPGEYIQNDAPFSKGRDYRGRGPLQIKWNYNYKQAGDFLGIDLLNDPDLLEKDPKIAWKTTIWYWIFGKMEGKKSAHEAITEGAGFGETIRAINRTGECQGTMNDRVQNRINRYKKFSERLKITPGEKLGC